MGDTRLVNGYAVEEARNGTWWVRRPDRPQPGWRFATRAEALRFALKLHPPQTTLPHPPRRRGAPP